MAGYTRQDTANNIANGNVIDADDFDAEYNTLEDAFNATTGHKHDGSAGEGAPITKVGPGQDVVVSTTAVTPKTTNTLDLGTSSVQYKDAFFDGTVKTDILTVDETSTFTGNVTASANLSVGGNLTVTGNATINGNLTFGDAATDTVAFGADINSNIVPDVDNTYDLGSSTQEWRNLYVDGTANIDSLVADTADINAGTIDGTVIGGASPAAISGTTITGSSLVGPLTGNVTGNVTGALTGNASTATALQTSRTIALSGDVAATGVAFDGTGNITLATTIQPNSVALGTDTTGNYVATIAGTANEVEVSGSGFEGATVTVGLPNSVTITNDLTVGGNLTVSGTTTTVNTETINLADNQIVLNSNYTGSTPTENGGIEIERGTLPNKTLVWDEAADKWTVGSEAFVAGTVEATTLKIGGVAVTSTAAELNKLDGVTATTTELNILDGVTATTTELNYVDGVTSNIQTQINTKAPTANPTFTGSVNAGDSIVLGSWTIWDSGGTLYFKYGTNNVFAIDSSGNITAEANVTAYGSV